MELSIEKALQQGITAHKEGKLQDAERLYRAILQSQPLHPDANHNLGVLAVSFNKADEALPLFKTALEANPKIEQFWLSYIDALIKEQHFENAKKVLEKGKKQGVAGEKLNVLEAQLVSINKQETVGSLSPSQQQLNSLFEHYQNGRLDDAEKLAVYVTQEFPQHPSGWRVLGVVLEQKGRKSEALDANQTLVALSPKDASAHSNLGNTLKKLGRLEDAEASYRQAITLKPDFAITHNNLGNLLQELARFDEAEASYTQAIALKSDYAEAHSSLGVTLKQLGRLEDAEASFRQAITLKPDYALAHSNLGVMLQELGRLDEAEASLRQAITLKPDYAKAHYNLTRLKKFDAQDEQYLKMQELYLNEDISEEQRCYINFGLAKACEDLENFEQAYSHYGEGNVLRKKLLNYDINQDVELFKQLKSSYPKIEKNLLEPDKLSKNLVPIFIVGMPRSGTTLVEQIISSHLQVTGVGELNFVKQFGSAIATGITEVNSEALLDFRHNYLDKLQNISNGNLIVTDKTPQNFHYIGLLAAAFPEAKIIHVKRNSAAVCWANYKQYFVSKNIGYCYAIDDVISYYKLYENLMEFWTNTLNNKIYKLDYELLTVNQESETRQLIDYLGLDWDEKCLSPQNNTRSITTASNLQVRQKVYQGSSEQWKKYQPFLNGAFDGLPLNEPKLAVQNKSLSFSQKRKKLSEQKKIKKKAKKQNLKANNPSQQQLNSLFEHYQNKRFSDAENLAVSITNKFPKHQFAWKVLGALLGATDRKSEAVDVNQTAVALSPQDAEAHYNLGITLKKLGRLDEAQASYKQAIALKPDYTEVHSNLGNTLKELGRLDESEASYRQAITLKPDYAEAHYNLAITLEELGRLDEALASYTQAIALKPDLAEAYVNLGITIKNVKFNSSNPKLYPPLMRLLSNGGFVRPEELAPSILSLLKHDIQIKDFLLKKNSAVSLKEANSIIRSLDKLPLLHHLMRLCPLPELQFEKLFVVMRSFLLKNLDKIEVSSELIYFLSTLSIHCFTNEYVYIESDEETHLIGKLQAKISQTLTNSEQPETIKVLCLASYRPLHQYNWCQKLESLDNLEEVKKRLIEEPLLEKVIAKDIPELEEISDDVSLKVKEQYEKNPYPRWEKLCVSTKTKPIAAVCDELELQLHSENIKNVTAPFILIAGCGTGQHSIGTASRFSNCHVTAVDLSLASLAYAQRKSNELCFTNIDYLQADILHLHQMGKEFDIIESGGVLHHMDEPMAGWRVLVDLLKPGGLMKIGLYSELARHHIVEIRKEIAELNIGTSEADIRKFRQSLAESNEEKHQLLTMSSDFFSLSMLRDLIFHVQEHRFTLQQIKNCLDELRLKFCGFENKDVISNFRELHMNEADIYDLELWHQFEERNPQAFIGMYEFWCQKY